MPRGARQSKKFTSAAYRSNGGKPKFDDATCREIKRKRDAGMTTGQLEAEYGVTDGTIRNAITRAEFGAAREQ